MGRTPFHRPLPVEDSLPRPSLEGLPEPKVEDRGIEPLTLSLPERADTLPVSPIDLIPAYRAWPSSSFEVLWTIGDSNPFYQSAKLMCSR